MFKLALAAGHYLYTSGRRCDKTLDPKETREWVLNDRIADKIEAILDGYDGIEVLRLDDTTGRTCPSNRQRTDAANEWDADFYLSIHHNAGADRSNAGGITAHVYTKASKESIEWQKELYKATVDATGLVGNRANPLVKNNLHEVRETKMPAVLMECGFMDSKKDVPVILTEAFADQMAKAIADVIVKRSGATKKAKTFYRVQVGAYEKKSNATLMLNQLKAAGFDGFIVTVTE